MNVMSSEIYQQMILEHNRRPKNFKRLTDPTHSGEGFNPMCGDHLWLDLRVDETGRVLETGFAGESCAICKASTSMMTAAVKGLEVEEAREFANQFRQLLQGKLDEALEKRLGSLMIFANIWKYPARVKCAGLAWHTLQAALTRAEAPASTENDGTSTSRPKDERTM